ncbi:unnamed protein product [Rhodiola kirilowii]
MEFGNNLKMAFMYSVGFDLECAIRTQAYVSDQPRFSLTFRFNPLFIASCRSTILHVVTPPLALRFSDSRLRFSDFFSIFTDPLLLNRWLIFSFFSSIGVSSERISSEFDFGKR